MFLNTIYKILHIYLYDYVFLRHRHVTIFQYRLYQPNRLKHFSSAEVFNPLCGSVFDGSQSRLLTQELAIAATCYCQTGAAAARDSIKMTLFSSQHLKSLIVSPPKCNVQETKTISNRVGCFRLGIQMIMMMMGRRRRRRRIPCSFSQYLQAIV